MEIETAEAVETELPSQAPVEGEASEASEGEAIEASLRAKLSDDGGGDEDAEESSSQFVNEVPMAVVAGLRASRREARGQVEEGLAAQALLREDLVAMKAEAAKANLQAQQALRLHAQKQSDDQAMALAQEALRAATDPDKTVEQQISAEVEARVAQVGADQNAQHQAAQQQQMAAHQQAASQVAHVVTGQAQALRAEVGDEPYLRSMQRAVEERAGQIMGESFGITEAQAVQQSSNEHEQWAMEIAATGQDGARVIYGYYQNAWGAPAAGGGPAGSSANALAAEAAASAPGGTGQRRTGGSHLRVVDVLAADEPTTGDIESALKSMLSE